MTAALCLATALAVAHIPFPAGSSGFTLAWTHSVERVRWEEDYRVVGGRLELVEARVRGSGAGMEPPEGALLESGWWRYRPDLPPFRELVLAASAFGGGYELCLADGCRPLASRLPERDGDAGPVRLRPCPDPR